MHKKYLKVIVTVCMMTSTETIEKIYNYQKTQELQLSLEQKAENAKEKAYRYCMTKSRQENS